MDEVGSTSCEWSREQNKAFERALAIHSEDDVNRWEKIAADVPEKTLEEIKHHYELLVEDIHKIESGYVPLANYESCLESSNSTKRASEGAAVKKRTKASGSYHWTKEEHRFVYLCFGNLFLDCYCFCLLGFVFSFFNYIYIYSWG